MSGTATQPAGSVVLVASAGRDSIATTLQCLRRQTVAQDLEIVLAARPEEVSGLKAISDAGFHVIKVVPADFSTSAIARSAAIRQATGDIVLFVEDHSFPTRADWAERLIATHRNGHAAVGPAMKNANPSTPTSWANIAIEYGQWINVISAGPVQQLPGHNSSYKRDILLQYGEDLADMLEAEWVMHNDLRERGETLWIDPEVSTAHLNFSRFGTAMWLHFLEGRMFAASRAARWSGAKRLCFALAFPLIFLVRFVRISGIILANNEARPHFIGILPACIVFLALSSLGEGVGYALGEGRQRPLLGTLEYDRWKFVEEDERYVQPDYI